MKRLRCISKAPEFAQSVSLEVKWTYVMDLIEITLPLVQNKNPQNPDGTTTGGDEITT